MSVPPGWIPAEDVFAVLGRLGLPGEINRLVLHPLGLSLNMGQRPDGSWHLRGMVIASDADKVGFHFTAADLVEIAKNAQYRTNDPLNQERATNRVASLGSVVQALPVLAEPAKPPTTEPATEKPV